MQSPVQIDFQGMEPLDRLQAEIARYVGELESRYGRITACHVSLKAPSEHHRTGAPYEVKIRLTLPDGRDVHIDRTRHADERHADANFALHDAFKRARRRLQDQARRMRGDVKRHEQEGAHPIGTVRQLHEEFGFLDPGDGAGDVYFHCNSVLNDAFRHLEPGMRVAFNEEAGEKGRQASTVRVLGKHAMR